MSHENEIPRDQAGNLAQNLLANGLRMIFFTGGLAGVFEVVRNSNIIFTALTSKCANNPGCVEYVNEAIKKSVLLGIMVISRC
ncbi:MAG: hypothetical protein WCJ58_05130 [bacterium]